LFEVVFVNEILGDFLVCLTEGNVLSLEFGFDERDDLSEKGIEVFKGGLELSCSCGKEKVV